MLEAIGLSSVESRTYAALVDNPQSTATELALQCEISARLASRTLAHLVRRGMASRLPGKRARYVAVAPDVSIQPLLNRREAELHQVRTAVRELMATFHNASRRTHPAELVEVVTGTRNIVSRAFALQDSARRSMRAFVKGPYLMPTEGNVDREFRRLAEGIEYRALYDRAELQHPDRLDNIRTSCQRGEKARVLPDLPLKVWIADDSAALIPIRMSNHAADAAFIVHASALLDALVALFELEWERATPIRFVANVGQAATDDGPDEQTKALLSLLAAGVTDEGMARALGLSVRTLQRRIHALMRELNATTRFQAGMAAKERGWL